MQILGHFYIFSFFKTTTMTNINSSWDCGGGLKKYLMQEGEDYLNAFPRRRSQPFSWAAPTPGRTDRPAAVFASSPSSQCRPPRGAARSWGKFPRGRISACRAVSASSRRLGDGYRWRGWGEKQRRTRLDVLFFDFGKTARRGCVCWLLSLKQQTRWKRCFLKGQDERLWTWNQTDFSGISFPISLQSCQEIPTIEVITRTIFDDIIILGKGPILSYF